MAFGGKVHHRSGLVLLEQAGYEGGVSNVALHKHVTGIALKRRQIVQITRIGEFVNVHHRFFMGGQPVQHEVGANKARAPRNQNHGFPL